MNANDLYNYVKPKVYMESLIEVFANMCFCDLYDVYGDRALI